MTTQNVATLSTFESLIPGVMRKIESCDREQIESGLLLAHRLVKIANKPAEHIEAKRLVELATTSRAIHIMLHVD